MTAPDKIAVILTGEQIELCRQIIEWALGSRECFQDDRLLFPSMLTALVAKQRETAQDKPVEVIGSYRHWYRLESLAFNRRTRESIRLSNYLAKFTHPHFLKANNIGVVRIDPQREEEIRKSAARLQQEGGR